MTMLLVDFIVRILDDPLVSRIHFTVAGLSINRLSFAAVRSAFRDKRIDAEATTTVPKGVAAFDRKKKKLLLSATDDVNSGALLGNRVYKAAIVHECVHAFVYLTGTYQVANEAAGYLAQAIYLKLAGDTKTSSDAKMHKDDPANPHMRILYEAFSVVDRYAMAYGHYNLSLAECQDLRDAIARHRLYGSQLHV
jgi:hypothetical protein